MEITYTMQNGYRIPELETPGERIELNRWGRMRLEVLRKRRRILYTQLLTSGKLTQHLQQVQTDMAELHGRLVQQMAKEENLTEQRKEREPLERVRRINAIRKTADELVMQEIMD